MRTDLRKASFNGACLRLADLDEAVLEEVDFTGANMSEAILKTANLEGADLTGATGLTKEQIDPAIIDENTKLPDYLPRDVQREPETT